eukprot:5735462-Amphidinium_carterae.2
MRKNKRQKENKKYNNENKDNNDEYDEEPEEMRTLNIYKMENRTIGMMQKMNIKLPSPTPLDGRYPQFYESAGEVKAYLSVHNVNMEDIMDDCTKFVTVIQLGDVQDKYTADEVRKHNTTHPVALQDGEDGYDDYMDMTVNIKKMRGDIVYFSQTLNSVLLHSTKPGSEAGSIIRRVMRQSNSFESWRQLQLHFAGGTELNNVRFFAQTCSRAGIATLDNSPSSTASDCDSGQQPGYLKGNIAQNLMMRIIQAATFDEVHQWISNYFNSTYTETDEDNKGQVGGVKMRRTTKRSITRTGSTTITIAYMEGKAQGQRKGKGKGKKGPERQQ